MRTTLHLVSCSATTSRSRGIYRESRIRELERQLAALGEDADFAADGERLAAFAAEQPSHATAASRAARAARSCGSRSGARGSPGTASSAYAGTRERPGSSVWRSHTAGGTFVPARTWLGADGASGDAAAGTSSAATSPRSDRRRVRTSRQWTGFARSVVDRGLAQLELRRFRDEHGRELYDLPRAPLPRRRHPRAGAPAAPLRQPRLEPRRPSSRARGRAPHRRHPGRRGPGDLPRRRLRRRPVVGRGRPRAGRAVRPAPPHRPPGGRGGGEAPRGVPSRRRQGAVTHWLGPDELRIGLGCMRLAKQADETIAAALDAGITVFDTARAYEGNEQLLARALRDANGARIVTKGGMARPNGAWLPDGRAKSIRADCEASLEALDGLPIDLYLLHAPDPRTPWPTSIRALARLVADGLVARIGVCNVNRAQLDEAVRARADRGRPGRRSAPFDDRALRGGVVERCAELGITVIAHSPLGGPRRARRLERHEALTSIARAHDATQAEVALAWLLGLGPNVVAIPGARRPETARSSARRGDAPPRPWRPRALGPDRAPDGRNRRATGMSSSSWESPEPEVARRRRVRRARVPAAQSRRARRLARGHRRRARRVARVGVSRGRPRQHVPHPRGAEPRRGDGARHGVPARCLWLDTPLAQAQVNLVERLLDRFGSLPSPDELKEGGAIGSGPALADPADAHVSRARASGRGRGLRIRRARAVRAGARAGTRGRLRRRRRRRSGWLGDAARRGRPARTASRLRLAAGRRAGRR